jgi:hypothetical protein
MTVINLPTEHAQRHVLAKLPEIDQAVWSLNDLLFRADGLLKAAGDLTEVLAGQEAESAKGLQAVLDELRMVVGQSREAVLNLLVATGADQRPTEAADTD